MYTLFVNCTLFLSNIWRLLHENWSDVSLSREKMDPLKRKTKECPTCKNSYLVLPGWGHILTLVTQTHQDRFIPAHVFAAIHFNPSKDRKIIKTRTTKCLVWQMGVTKPSPYPFWLLLTKRAYIVRVSNEGLVQTQNHIFQQQLIHLNYWWNNRVSIFWWNHHEHLYMPYNGVAYYWWEFDYSVVESVSILPEGAGAN